MSEKNVIEFGAEVGKILQLMIHSLYTNKDIFLRELISNSSDASDKLRYMAVTDQSILENDSDFSILVKTDPKNKTISVIDNGIGMNRDDLIKNIGTIASSGTQKFLEQMQSGSDINLIGQFGVGFYSGFMVADKIEVFTRKAGEKKAWHWESEGKNNFSINEVVREKRGTEIVLHLKEDAIEYLDKFKVKYIINTYSDHISIPVKFQEEDGEIETINKASALWMRSKSDITADQYKEFYRQVAHQPDDPWLVMHNKNEGNLEFTNLLFIPGKKPFDLFHPDRKPRVKLYVKRVFITEDCEDLVPQYLRFLRGIVDSEDLPLNISRETLQANNLIAKMRKSIVAKVLSELKKKLADSQESYIEFWENFGAALKEGLCEYSDNHEQILQVCLFKSLLQDKYITVDEYIGNMKENQKEIYYLSGDSIDSIKNSPQLEGFKKRGIDVLLFTDPVDDFWTNVETNYKEKEFKSVTRSSIDFEEKEEQSQEKQENKEEVIAYFKEVLGSLVKDVVPSKKLVDSPVCLSTSEDAMDIRMERFLKEQKQLAFSSPKILEVNLTHPLINKLEKLIKEDMKKASILIKTLYDQSCIIEGEPVVNAAEFASRMNKMIEEAL